MKDTSAILDKLYPIVETSMNKNMNKYKKVIDSFIEKRSTELYAIAPYTRIYFNTEDAEELYKALDIGPKTIRSILEGTYYWKINPFNPAAAKDEFTILAMCIVRYFYLKKSEKDLEMAMTYLAFSGKFYPSIHYGSYKKVQPSEYKHVMDYVVNNTLSNKFDIKKYGSVVGAIRSVCNSWIDSYEKMVKRYSDEDITYLIQQLHTRIKSFMKNIATEYYKAIENKDYLTYNSDSLSDDNFYMADNDSFKADKIVEKTMNYINSTTTNITLCQRISDGNVRANEIKSIIDSILSDNKNLAQVRELITLIIITYFAQSKTKDIHDISFITFTIAPKPNAKNKDILRQKEIIENWLEESSSAYRKRKSRIATKNSYFKVIFMYFTLLIVMANK